MRLENLRNKVISFVKKILLQRSTSFTGLGFIVYDDSFDHCIHTDIYSKLAVPSGICIDSKAAIDFFLELGCRENPYHDGFSFIRSDGFLTHIAQYVTPPIRGCVDVPEGLGARYMTAHYSSLIPGVLLTAIVCSHGGGYVFQRGDVEKIS